MILLGRDVAFGRRIEHELGTSGLVAAGLTRVLAASPRPSSQNPSRGIDEVPPDAFAHYASVVVFTDEDRTR
jgi:hypothetical protein